MESIERICPNCGTGNASDRPRCVHCGARLAGLPEARRNLLPARLEGAGTAALVVGAAALLARVGLRMLVRGVLPAVARSVQLKNSREQPAPTEWGGEPGYVIRGWRTWSIRRGAEHSSGSEQFEWRVQGGGGGTGKKRRP